jgi:hypothetical protein
MNRLQRMQLEKMFSRKLQQQIVDIKKEEEKYENK